MMFRGPRPAAQPRTLRSIAEDKGTAPAGFVDGGIAPSGLPISAPTAMQHYVGKLPGVIPGTAMPPGPSPFGVVRRSR
jgi:hypothetical protein